MFAIMHDRGDNRGVGAARGEDFQQMPRFACTTGCDYGNRHRLADEPRDFEIIAELGAVTIDRVDAQFTSAETRQMS